MSCGAHRQCAMLASVPLSASATDPLPPDEDAISMNALALLVATAVAAAEMLSYFVDSSQSSY